MTKSKKTFLAVVISAASVLIVFCAGYTFWAIGIAPLKLSMDICNKGWEDKLTYSMLSNDLQEIISEEEFTDESPLGRLAIYRKLENLTLDDRSTNKFKGSTSFWKSPCIDIIEVDNKEFYVDIQIDLDAGLIEPKVVNFTTIILSNETER